MKAVAIILLGLVAATNAVKKPTAKPTTTAKKLVPPTPPTTKKPKSPTTKKPGTKNPAVVTNEKIGLPTTAAPITKKPKMPTTKKREYCMSLRYCSPMYPIKIYVDNDRSCFICMYEISTNTHFFFQSNLYKQNNKHHSSMLCICIYVYMYIAAVPTTMKPVDGTSEKIATETTKKPGSKKPAVPTTKRPKLPTTKKPAEPV